MAQPKRQPQRGRELRVQPHAHRTSGRQLAASQLPLSQEMSRQALRHGLEPLEARQMLSVTTDEQDWTVFGRSADTRVVYVSNSAGDDANSGSIARISRGAEGLEHQA